MVGPPKARGVAFRALSELMSLAEGAAPILKVDVDASMVEVYNGRVRDLAADVEGEEATVPEGAQPLSVRAALAAPRPRTVSFCQRPREAAHACRLVLQRA